MSKGWCVKVDTQVVFNVDTNIGVLASTEEQAGRVAQEIVNSDLDLNKVDYIAQISAQIPWDFEIAGMSWSRSGKPDIDFDTMQVVYVEPDTDFDPDDDEELKSSCCYDTLLNYSEFLGIGRCNDCGEWSGPYNEESQGPVTMLEELEEDDDDEVKEDTAVVRDLMEAAQCLNECFHNRMSLVDDHPLKGWQERYGIAEVRDQLNLCAIYCDNLYRLMMDEQGYDGCFDFDFCPQFLENCVDHDTFKPKSEDMRVLSMYFSRIGE